MKRFIKSFDQFNSLNESHSLGELAQGKHPKKVADALNTLIAMQSMDVIPERDFLKAIGVIYSIKPKLVEMWDSIPYATRVESGLDYTDFSGITPEIIHLDSFNRKIETLSRVKNAMTDPAYKKLAQDNIDILNEWLPVAQEIYALRKKVKSMKEINTRKRHEEIKGKTHPQIQEEVEKIAQDFKVLIKDNWLKSFEHYISRWETDRAIKGVDNPLQMYPKREDADFRMRISQVLNQDRKTMAITPKSTAELDKMAEDRADAEAKEFSFKMSFKLGGLFPKSNIKIAVEKSPYSSSTRSNRLRFIINDGESSFTVMNQIVHSWSVLQTPFYRYPTTFHNLIIKGQHIQHANELTIKKALNQAYPE